MAMKRNIHKSPIASLRPAAQIRGQVFRFRHFRARHVVPLQPDQDVEADIPLDVLTDTPFVGTCNGTPAKDWVEAVNVGAQRAAPLHLQLLGAGEGFRPSRHTMIAMPLRNLILLCATLLLTLPTFAQETTPAPEITPEVTAEPAEDTPFIGDAEVAVESLFVRELPTQESEAVGSLFEEDRLQVVGRNIDGSWFQVRRQGRAFNLGWVLAEYLGYDFAPELLPLTNGDVGLEGDTAVIDTGFAVYYRAEGALRNVPFVTGELLLNVPLGSVLPVLARDDTSSWFQVNYRGTIGWVSRAAVRPTPNIAAVPVYRVPGVPVIDAPIIAPEIQLAQLERFREYAVDSYDVANGLAEFWFQVSLGEVMPCEPPPFVEEYLVGRNDVRELPELDRYVPRFNEGILLLNDSIEPLTQCGVLDQEVVTDARNAAINARVIFSATQGQLDSLEELILTIQTGNAE